ncbi:MAG: hypothetical protein GY842_08200, partial [bacterium]|nr:hypothetical protein [bacterium]
TTEEEAEAEDRCQPDREAGERSAGRFLWLWLAVCPFAALAILAAVTPPGVLWAEEGNGYDVLEYHLQLPKEYLEAGRIDYVPHNVYANFPANVEMLYLLSLLVRGDVVEGALLAKLLNLGLAVLFVAAAWLAGRETSRVAGVFSGVAAGGAGYVAYLCGVAFVELGMLFFGMLALAAFIRAIDP